jgi:hypothetical protein
MRLEHSPYNGHEIERDIWLNGGRVVKNPINTTKFTFIKPQYIKRCIEAKAILPLSPLYLAVLPSNNSRFYQENFDKFGDSYTTNIDLQELTYIVSHMGSGYEIDEDLIGHIGFKHPRSHKMSICFDVK